MADDWCVKTLRRIVDDWTRLDQSVTKEEFTKILDSSRLQLEQANAAFHIREVLNFVEEEMRHHSEEDVDVPDLTELNGLTTCTCTHDVTATVKLGRPRINLQRSQLVSLLNYRFTVPQISKLCGVSVRTVQRRMSEYNLFVRDCYSNISDSDLDAIVKDIQHMFPTCGNRQMLSYLQSRGIIVQQNRVRESQQRIDPANSAMRKLTLLKHQKYMVNGPLALWHIDGNHKLIRWKFVIHGGIDGYSRKIVYLRCSCNNRAETVYNCFKEAIASYGIPSRI
jgi:hypothetical protein